MAGLKAVGDFKLDKAEIVTSSGMVIDLSASILNITIFEDTGMTAVTGDILLQSRISKTKNTYTLLNRRRRDYRFY
jgi:hypothetical protein